ncbi:hypothetical protein I307_03551 [Cryptococcus deuterogattii 99/473]|uniref:Uncharacterized protein n=2 Tax=Cryptococcus deuterogattii TaxID=1859096 RepID=A0A0D0TBD3_9TREE|nr:hypothetical protein CNBG_3521 [Cryptococcus deuterogattii R265]KIR30442.1 hypothetical protein I309_00579 [Cryptococcus deuterogattii LA55]KIR36896.1 hypothetical protein I352_00208 [Cryptococcus deuterogattii MMRL2647]KIR43367.1 hypothetical protein I313_00209 [Cryptococcus deuterogattii Ram5]KIR74700.1 hypothetical protein I310_00974 [Cryptococcus deuterogattii CA1014]KIR92373.1 hypothetical protein I304_03777 [Cryptococcus deuterogattii CBS 10090]KIY57217.1 hypothetical protein I307_03
MIEITAGQLLTKTVDRFAIQSPPVRNQFRVEEARQLESKYGCDDMAELSDSPSSVKTSSRPVIPSHPPPSPVHISTQGSLENEISKLADKAEKILGLTPGTLAYAQACLENARDEVRRMTLSPSPESSSIITKDDKPPSHLDMGGGGIKGKMQTRARKTTSITRLGAVGHQKIASVVLSAGGKEEEHRREKRRRAVDSVLHWQKEVARLEETDK